MPIVGGAPYMKKIGWLLAGAALLGALNIKAATSAAALSAEELAGIHRLAVVSLMGGSFSGVSTGLGPFDRQYLHATPGWDIDGTIEEAATRRLRASGKFRSIVVERLDVQQPEVVLQRDRRHPIDLKALAAIGRSGGYDSVLAVVPHQPWDRPDLPAGFSLNRRRVIGGSADVTTCAAIRIVVIRALDGALLAEASPALCRQHGEALPWHAVWSDYSSDEARRVLSALERQAELASMEGLAQLGVPSGYRPGHRASR